jgi:hypothetical protein
MFIAATWALKDVGFIRSSIVLAGVVIGHYVASYDRVAWLIRQ